MQLKNRCNEKFSIGGTGFQAPLGISCFSLLCSESHQPGARVQLGLFSCFSFGTLKQLKSGESRHVRFLVLEEKFRTWVRFWVYEEHFRTSALQFWSPRLTPQRQSPRASSIVHQLVRRTNCARVSPDCAFWEDGFLDGILLVGTTAGFSEGRLANSTDCNDFCDF